MTADRSHAQWDYPLFLIPHGGGYASVVDQSEGETRTLLVVHTNEELAENFMRCCSLGGAPRALHNDREFRWLLISLRDPVRYVAFDPQAEMAEGLRARWTISVRTLLDEHMDVDYSPWNYPVYAIEQPAGFASIEGRQSSGQSWRAVNLFTAREKAESYLQGAEEEGELVRLADMTATRDLLESLSDDVSAVALDPLASGEERSAKHCFVLTTLLEKYLKRAGD